MGRRRSAWGAVASVLAGVLLAGPGATASVPPAGTTKTGTDRGTWLVQDLGPGRYAVSWTSPAPLPTGSDRPTVVGPARWRIGTATVAADGRTVLATVTAAEPPDPAGLDVVLSGDRLDETGNDLARRTAAAASAPLDLPGTSTLAEDPGVAGPHAVVSSDYTLAGIRVPGLRNRVEMVGHVVEPAPGAVTGPRPLVLVMHGRHTTCYRPGHPGAGTQQWPCRGQFREVPSHLGYDYVQQVLASQGYATVSVRVNGVNAQDDRMADGGADARARVVQAHLDHWTGVAASHQVDLSRVVLVGHSRGGEGVARAAIRIPLTAPYRVVGEVLLAPTDFGSQTAPYVPTVTVLPFCDGDVADLQGQRYTDTARGLVADDTSLKSSVLVMGANHNFFNTEWTPGVAQAPAFDDWSGPSGAACGSADPQRLSAADQRAVATAYVAGAVHLFAAADDDVLPLFDGSRARVASQGSAQTLSHAIGGGRSVRAPVADASLAPAQGAVARLCRGDQDTSASSSCARDAGQFAAAPHWRDYGVGPPTRSWLEMAWTQAGQTAGLLLAQPLDLTGRRLELRTIADPRTATSLEVRVTDADGATADLVPLGGGGLPALGADDDRKLWAQAVVVDPAAAPVDLAHIVRVDLVSGTAHGRLWVADLAAAPATLAAVPAHRLPTIDLDNRRVTEGSGGAKVVKLPFHVRGTLTTPARFVVVTIGQRPGDVRRRTVDLVPGQTGGTIAIRYVADRRPDYRRLVTQVGAWATSNVMTDDYTGVVTILDDDPPPRIVVRTVARTVEEGQPARWRVELSRTADYQVSVAGRVVRGSGRPVAIGDVAESWIDLHVGTGKPGRQLWTTGVVVFGTVDAGKRALEIVVPTRKDRATERPETLSVVFEVGGRTYRRSVVVVDG